MEQQILSIPRQPKCAVFPLYRYVRLKFHVDWSQCVFN
jgi:hypothetical protein